MENNTYDFSAAQRQSILGVVVYFIKNGRRFLGAILVLYASSRQFGNYVNYIWLGLGIIVLLSLIISYLQYRFFTFHLEKEELVINSGVIFKERRIIPFDRIQSVHIHQNLIQQILQVVGLKIDSAGSKEKELEISALDRQMANAFQNRIQQLREANTEDEVTGSDVYSETKTNARLLLKLDIRDILRVGLTENHIRSGLLAIAVVYGYFWQYSEYFEDYLKEYATNELQEYLPEIVKMSLIMIGLGILLFLIFSVIFSVVRTVLRFFNFQAWLEKGIIAISSGLLKRNEYRIPVRKIQYLMWQSNPLRKLLGFQSVKIRQAQSTRKGKNTSIEIPACYAPHNTVLEELVFGRPIPEGTDFIRPNIIPYMLISTYAGVFLIAAGLLISFVQLGQPYLWITLLLPIIWFLTYKYAKSIRIETREDLLIIYKGWIFPHRIIVPFFKAQSVGFAQSIFLKRRNIANCRFYTASGSIGLRYLPEDFVFSLYNYTMYKTESHKGSWM